MTRTAEPAPMPAGRDADAHAEPREPMTLERARTLSVLRVQDVADLLGVSPKTIKRTRDVPGRIAELRGAVRYRAAIVVAWLTEERGASGKKSR